MSIVGVFFSFGYRLKFKCPITLTIGEKIVGCRPVVYKTGTVKVQLQNEMKIILDGQSKSAKNAVFHGVTPGVYTLKISNNDTLERTAIIDVEEDQLYEFSMKTFFTKKPIKTTTTIKKSIESLDDVQIFTFQDSYVALFYGDRVIVFDNRDGEITLESNFDSENFKVLKNNNDLYVLDMSSGKCDLYAIEYDQKRLIDSIEKKSDMCESVLFGTRNDFEQIDFTDGIETYVLDIKDKKVLDESGKEITRVKLSGNNLNQLSSFFINQKILFLQNGETKFRYIDNNFVSFYKDGFGVYLNKDEKTQTLLRSTEGVYNFFLDYFGEFVIVAENSGRLVAVDLNNSKTVTNIPILIDKVEKSLIFIGENNQYIGVITPKDDILEFCQYYVFSEDESALQDFWM